MQGRRAMEALAMSKRLNRFLIVDAAENASAQFSRVGTRLGYLTDTTRQLDEFTAALVNFVPTVIMIDLPSVEKGGLDYLKAIRDQESKARIILTSDADARDLDTATQLAEFLGLSVIASPRTSVFMNVLRDELRKSHKSKSELTPGDLGKALKNGDVRPYYQPRASYGTRGDWSITEVEAVPRWHAADDSVVMPEEFVWLAEGNGMMTEITNALLDQALDQCATWRLRKLDLGASVHLPASSLSDRSLPESVFQMSRAKKIDPSMLILEVSEGSVMNYSSTVVDVLGQLKSMGFRLAIGEFGTSYSSLEQLCRLKVDELKIDRALVAESRSSGEARTIIEATVLLAHKLGIKVCAEGVDSQRSLKFLGRIGCDKVQGKIVGNPLSADDLEEHLNERNQSAQAG